MLFYEAWLGAGEMAQWLRAQVLPGDISSITNVPHAG